MNHPARGPAFAGIAGKVNAASCRTCGVSITIVRAEAAGVSGSYPTPFPVMAQELKRSPKSLIHKAFTTLALLSVALCLSGCPATAEKSARGNERWYHSVVEPLQSEPERALRFYDRIIRLKGADLVHELETARQGYEKEKTELGRVELAMILSLPGTTFRDERAAASLLQPYVKDRSLEQSPLRPLALLLNAQLVEARKLDDSLQQQAAKAREEQKKAEDLQQKLDALLEMEKKMLEREQTLPTNKK